MSRVFRPSEGDPSVFQFCKACLLGWLGPQERAALPLQAAPETVKPPEPKKDDLPQEVREMMAIHKVELIAERAKLENSLDASHLPLWQKYLAAFGFPVEDEGRSLERAPWATLTAIVLTSIVSIYFFTDFIPSVETYGFIPSEFDRWGGLTFLTCFFVHGGWMHLLGNMYFLLLFGRGVEDRLGPAAFVGVLALATFGGCLLTVLMDPGGTIPHVGASGGISGVLLLYTLLFPKSKLVFMFSAHVARPQLVRLPAWAMLALWIGSQLVGLSFQSSGVVPVSYSGHVGGLLGGLAFWLFWKWSKSGGLIKVDAEK
jgi:membrane associated rhomboid family serine protease